MLAAALIIVIIILALLVGGLASNHLPLRDPPGVWVRLSTYVGSNVAETSEQSPFPELRPRRYTLAPEALYSAILEVIQKLGWQLSLQDRGTLQIRAVVATPLWRFKDDIQIRVVPDPAGSSVYFQSKSRIGKGDLGANARHILDFYEGLDRTFQAKSG